MGAASMWRSGRWVNPHCGTMARNTGGAPPVFRQLISQFALTTQPSPVPRRTGAARLSRMPRRLTRIEPERANQRQPP